MGYELCVNNSTVLQDSRWDFGNWLPFYSIIHQSRQEFSKRNYVLAHTGFFQCRHIDVPFFHWNYSPGIATASQHRIH